MAVFLSTMRGIIKRNKKLVGYAIIAVLALTSIILIALLTTTPQWHTPLKFDSVDVYK